MVKVFIKGGIWKNSEDEILKAAVMKYGKQSWSRVASLLNRKSAKQCKARWHEWLDPSVRKIEWSREEDEKLLHLAKLMPAQWKTIGPLVGGRTAIQCKERYEKLLDEAAAAAASSESGSNELAGAGAAAALASQARLRPGEIDPHPETKPARPDPIDMDEDEIEMLQEARARLANTQGKKAKRKARGKMLDEAKRLADLNKRRELKQAGLLSSAARTKAMRGKRKRGEMDLGVEIPFHKPAPAGFHDTADEDRRADMIRNKRLRDVNVKQINESQYRTRDREEKEAQKRDAARLRALERSNMQYIVAEVSKANDPVAVRMRGVLNMPEPNVTDSELEKIAKMAQEEGMEHKTLALASQGGKATDALLGDYEDRVLPTPMRSNMGDRTSKQEAIMREASNLRMLERGQTPLLGGENPTLYESSTATSVKSTKYVTDTPRIGGSDTPMTSRGRFSQTPLTAVPRDQLGLNPMAMTGDDISVSATSFATTITGRTKTIKEIAREERMALKQARKELEIALAALPSPQFDYELAVPEAVTEDEDQERANNSQLHEKDALDVENEKRTELFHEASKRFKMQSSVLKRQDLPRPFGLIERTGVERVSSTGADGTASHGDCALSAAQLILDEMYLLLEHDAFSNPCLAQNVVTQANQKDRDKKDKSKRRQDTKMTLPPKPSTPLETFSEEDVHVAKMLLENELGSADISLVHYETASADTRVEEQVIDIKHEFQSLKEAANFLRKKADKLEAKLNIKNQGYAKRCDSMKQDILLRFAEFQHMKIEKDVFSMLLVHEERGFEQRIKKLKDEIDILRESESSSQKRYGALLHEKNRYLMKLKNKETSDAAR